MFAFRIRVCYRRNEINRPLKATVGLSPPDRFVHAHSTRVTTPTVMRDHPHRATGYAHALFLATR